MTHAPGAPAALRRAARSDSVEMIARAGHFARGAVFILVGALAGMAAIGAGGDTDGSEGAFRMVLAQPLGWAALVLVAGGLGAFSLWRVAQALGDPGGEAARGWKGAPKRIGWTISAVIYAGLAWTAGALATGSVRAEGGGDSARDWTASLMSQPFGRWLVAAVGAGIAGFGLWQLYRAYSVRLGEWLDLSRLTPRAQRAVIWLGRSGLAARGVVFATVGVFLLIAAWRADPSEARGLGGALRALAEQPYGPWILGAVALGLMAYGAYVVIEGAYRKLGAAAG